MTTPYDRLETAFAGRDAPFAFVDLDAMWSNAHEMLGRAGPKPIRVASKSVRCRELLERILAHDPRFRGLMTFTLRRDAVAALAGLRRPAAGVPDGRYGARWRSSAPWRATGGRS